MKAIQKAHRDAIREAKKLKKYGKIPTDVLKEIVEDEDDEMNKRAELCLTMRKLRS